MQNWWEITIVIHNKNLVSFLLWSKSGFLKYAEGSICFISSLPEKSNREKLSFLKDDLRFRGRRMRKPRWMNDHNRQIFLTFNILLSNKQIQVYNWMSKNFSSRQCCYNGLTQDFCRREKVIWFGRASKRSKDILKKAVAQWKSEKSDSRTRENLQGGNTEEFEVLLQ